MADNSTLPATGDVIASDDVGGVKYQRVKIAVGADGTAVDQGVAAAGIPKIGNTDSAGQVQYNFPAGFVRTSDEPVQVFYDPFDGSTVDITNRWTPTFGLGAAVTPSQASGQLVVNAGATSTGYAYLTSQPSFTPSVPAWIGYSFAVNLTDGASLVSTGYRFWGAGTSPAAPSVAAPMTDAVGFEITGGKLCAVVYAAGVRTLIADLSTAGTAPTDTANHRYIVYIRTDRSYWYIDSLATPVATSSFQSPSNQVLPVKYLAVSGGSATTINSPGLAVWDTGKNALQIADGTNPWRRATVSTTGELSVRTGTRKITGQFAAGTFGVNGAASSPINLATIHNVAGATYLVLVRAITVEITLIATAAAFNTGTNIRMYRGTTVPSGGTAATKHQVDTNETASGSSTVVTQPASADGTATAITYGLPAGNPMVVRGHVGTSASSSMADPTIIPMWSRDQPPLVLRAGQSVLVATVNNSAVIWRYSVNIEWDEGV